MRKIICFLLLSLGLQAQIVNIPDANFKAKLLAASVNPTYTNIAFDNDAAYAYHAASFSFSWNTAVQSVKIDLNNDGEISISEAQNIKALNINNANISNLTGIEAFQNLKFLQCSGNIISNFSPVTGLSGLKEIRCSNNLITNISTVSLGNLVFLECNNNLLTNLTLNNGLQRIDCNFNQLTSLYISNEIKRISCKNNILSNLIISQSNYTLKRLDCSNNQLTTLNVSQIEALQNLICNNNQISDLNLSYKPDLIELNCNNNLLTSLNLENCTAHQNYASITIECKNNNLINIFSKNGKSNYIFFENNPNLIYICCDENDIFPNINLYPNCNLNSYCSFTPGGTFYNILGNNKFDTDNNGCDSNDSNFPNLKYNLSNGTVNGILIANASGNYTIPVSSGTHIITLQLENPSYYNVSPTSATVTFPATASPFNQNFCITPNGVHHDIEVTLIPITPARPGFNATYKIIYKNKGNQIENGAVTLTYLNQDALDIVSCNPAFNSENSDGFEKTLTWNYVNLQPFQTREITVVLNLNGPMETPALNIGETLSMTSTVTPEINDETPIDNSSSIRQVIVGSYDPNDKTCIEGATITPAMVGEYVHYVIRFENTGTFPAENIVVKDMIDLAKFDIATLLPIKASHNFETRIAGNKVEFIFENINLPFDDANNDGYVAFKIKTKPSLVLGNTFSNQANIYFDYNFPIITNTATTTIAALSTTDFDFGTHFTLYPNPVKEVLNFQSKDNTSIHSIEIYTTLGQVVLAVTDTLSTVDVSSLKAGNYIVKVHTDLGVSNTKFIKE
jgi:hypothetical protein